MNGDYFDRLPPIRYEAVLTIAYAGGAKSEDLVLPFDDLLKGIADLEMLHNAIEVYRAGGPGSDRAHQFHTVFGHCVKPAHVLAAALRIRYNDLDGD